MKRGIVYYRDIPAGEFVKDDDGYLIRYDSMYYVDPSMPDISATLPNAASPWRRCSTSRPSPTRQRRDISFASTTGFEQSRNRQNERAI